MAQLDLYNGSQNNYPGTGTVATSGDFLVPDGTELVATLNNNLTTRDTRENDRFTLTVQQPSQYYGATINGYVTNVTRSGRITGRSQLTLNFESITMRDGRSYRFAGIAESVQTANERSPVGALLFTCNGRGTRMFRELHHDAGVVSELQRRAAAGGTDD